MRTWHFWLNTLVLSSQYNPPRLVELLMLFLAMVMLGIWSFTPMWPYLALGLSFMIGSSISILVREAIAPSPQMRTTQVIVVLLLILCIYSFTDLVR